MLQETEGKRYAGRFGAEAAVGARQETLRVEHAQRPAWSRHRPQCLPVCPAHADEVGENVQSLQPFRNVTDLGDEDYGRLQDNQSRSAAQDEDWALGLKLVMLGRVAR